MYCALETAMLRVYRKNHLSYLEICIISAVRAYRRRLIVWRRRLSTYDLTWRRVFARGRRRHRKGRSFEYDRLWTRASWRQLNTSTSHRDICSRRALLSNSYLCFCPLCPPDGACRGKTSGHYAHPGDQSCYIHCDQFGAAFAVHCAVGTRWNERGHSSSPSSFNRCIWTLRRMYDL